MKIGHGWKFRHVFSGSDGVIFAINDAGEFSYYKYLGMNTGAETWGPVGKPIGTGWIFDHVFAEFPTRMANPPPRTEKLPPPEDPKCAAYASAAVAAFRDTASPKCKVASQNGVWRRPKLRESVKARSATSSSWIAAP
jgi:hypothetical protein